MTTSYRTNCVRVASDFTSDPMKATIAEAKKAKVHPALRDSSLAVAIPLWRDRRGERASPPRRPARREAEDGSCRRHFGEHQRAAGLSKFSKNRPPVCACGRFYFSRWRARFEKFRSRRHESAPIKFCGKEMARNQITAGAFPPGHRRTGVGRRNRGRFCPRPHPCPRRQGAACARRARAAGKV